MILRFKMPDNSEYVNINTTAEVYNYGETVGAYYIAVEEKDYIHIIAEMDFNCYGYDEYLGLNVPDEYHPFSKSDLNNMCIGCTHLYNLCSGTKCQVYSGCIWKDAPADSLVRYLNGTGKAELDGAQGGIK